MLESDPETDEFFEEKQTHLHLQNSDSDFTMNNVQEEIKNNVQEEIKNNEDANNFDEIDQA
jgi:hypothetical protein